MDSQKPILVALVGDPKYTVDILSSIEKSNFEFFPIEPTRFGAHRMEGRKFTGFILSKSAFLDKYSKDLPEFLNLLKQRII